MQMFVLDFPLSRPIYFLAFRFLSRLFIFDFFRLFSWRFSSAFFYRDHIYYRLIPAYLRSAETWQVWFLALQLFCLSPSVMQLYKAMLHERGDVTESYYYLFSHNKLGVLLLWKDDSFRCLSSCFMPPKFHIFSGDHALRFLLPPPPSGPTSACSSRFVSYKPIYFQRAIKNFSFD